MTDAGVIHAAWRFLRVNHKNLLEKEREET